MSLGQIAAPMVVLSVLMGGICFYFNASLGPQSYHRFNKLFVEIGMENPLALIEEGKYMREFPGYVIYVGKKRDKDLEHVTLYLLNDDGNVISSVRARRAIISARPERHTLLLDMYDVRGDLRDPRDPTNIEKIRAGTTARRYPVELDLGKILRKSRAKKKLRDYTLGELREEIVQLKQRGIFPSATLLEVHGRLSGAVACVAFTLVGIPLGLKTSRRETSIGIAISLVLAFIYYFFVILATTLKDRPDLYPEAIIWVPSVAFELIGIWLLWRVSRR